MTRNEPPPPARGTRDGRAARRARLADAKDGRRVSAGARVAEASAMDPFVVVMSGKGRALGGAREGMMPPPNLTST